MPHIFDNLKAHLHKTKSDKGAEPSSADLPPSTHTHKVEQPLEIPYSDYLAPWIFIGRTDSSMICSIEEVPPASTTSLDKPATTLYHILQNEATIYHFLHKLRSGPPKYKENYENALWSQTESLGDNIDCLDGKYLTLRFKFRVIKIVAKMMEELMWTKIAAFSYFQLALTRLFFRTLGDGGEPKGVMEIKDNEWPFV